MTTDASKPTRDIRDHPYFQGCLTGFLAGAAFVGAISHNWSASAITAAMLARCIYLDWSRRFYV